MRLRLLFMLLIFIFPPAAMCQLVQAGTDRQISPNLISNGNFMARDPLQRPLRWTMGAELQTAVLTRKQRHSPQPDDHSLKLSDSSTTAGLVVRSEKHIANPGTKYTASAWFKSGKGTAGQLLLEFWDQNNKRIGMAKATPTPDTAWTLCTAVSEAPDKVTHVTVALVSGKDDTGISYCDDVSLVYEYAYQKNIAAGVHELFLDDYRIESMLDVQRLVHAGKKSAPLIKPTEPWEGNAAYIYGTVLHNEPAGSGYRMWYTAYIDKQYYLCYATSEDGIHWKKPHLSIVEYNGNKNNNICRIGGGTLLYDKYDKDSNRRYKLMAVSRVDNGKKFGYGVWFSPDGFHWTAYEGNPVISYADVSNIAYDTSRKLFIAATKQRMLVSNTSVTPNKMDRAAFISVSKDFIHWSAPMAPGSQWTLAVEGDPVDDMLVMAKGGLEGQIYGMTVHPYEGVYVGMPWCFDLMDYNNGIYAGYGDGPIQPEIAASRDLRHWSRASREPVIPLGKAGAWDDGTVYTATTMQVTEKEISIYYGAMNLAHGGDQGARKQIAQIAKATWRRDGFISLHNEGNDEGIITTKPFIFSGNKLQVNAKLFPQGTVKVEILDASGRPVPEYSVHEAIPVKGDQYAATVQWKNASNISKLQGKEIRLRFYVKGGDLYSYWFLR
jgi:hypothetical protein